MGRRFSLAALAALGLPALLLSGWLIYSRSAFGTWDPTAQPDRISYCGRTYLPGEHVSRAIIDSTNSVSRIPVKIQHPWSLDEERQSRNRFS